MPGGRSVDEVAFSDGAVSSDSSDGAAASSLSESSMLSQRLY